MATLDDVRRIARGLPEAVEDGRQFGFGVANKGKTRGFVWSWKERVHPRKGRVENLSVVAVRVADLDEKELLLAADPAKFFTEPHYNGYPAVLVRLGAIDAEELGELVVEAWRCMAPKPLVEAYGRGRPDRGPADTGEGEGRADVDGGRELVARIERGWAELSALIGGVPAERLTAAPPDGGWSAKDHLAHLLTWTRVALSRAGQGGYSAEAEAEIFGLEPAGYRATDEDGLNAVARRLHRDRSLGEVMADLRDAHGQVVAAVAALGEAQLGRPWLPGRPERGPLIGTLRGNTYEHYHEHAGYIRRLLGG